LEGQRQKGGVCGTSGTRILEEGGELDAQPRILKNDGEMVGISERGKKDQGRGITGKRVSGTKGQKGGAKAFPLRVGKGATGEMLW